MYQGYLTRDSICHAHVLSDGCLRPARRRSMTSYDPYCIVNRHAHPLTLRIHRGLLREYESSVELVHSLFDQPLAHGDPEDDHLRAERLTE
jgi:hypothetical protein